MMKDTEWLIQKEEWKLTSQEEEAEEEKLPASCPIQSYHPKLHIKVQGSTVNAGQSGSVGHVLLQSLLS